MNAPRYTRITARKKFGNNNNEERRVANRSGSLLVAKKTKGRIRSILQVELRRGPGLSPLDLDRLVVTAERANESLRVVAAVHPSIVG